MHVALLSRKENGREKKKEEKKGGYAVWAGVCDDDGTAAAAAVVSSTSMAVVGLVWVGTVWVDSQNAPGTGWAWMKVAVNMRPAGISSIVMPRKGPCVCHVHTNMSALTVSHVSDSGVGRI